MACNKRRSVQSLSEEFPHVDFQLIASNEDPFASSSDGESPEEQQQRYQDVFDLILNTEQHEIVCCSHGCFLESLFNEMGIHEYHPHATRAPEDRRWWLDLLREEHWEHTHEEKHEHPSLATLHDKDITSMTERERKQHREELARKGREVRRRGYTFYFENCQMKSGVMFFVGEGWGERGLVREQVHEEVLKRRKSFTEGKDEES